MSKTFARAGRSQGQVDGQEGFPSPDGAGQEKFLHFPGRGGKPIMVRMFSGIRGKGLRAFEQGLKSMEVSLEGQE